MPLAAVPMSAIRADVAELLHVLGGLGDVVGVFLRRLQAALEVVEELHLRRLGVVLLGVAGIFQSASALRRFVGR
jgi:hypothetical protein